MNILVLVLPARNETKGRACSWVQWELRDLLCGASVLKLEVHIFNNLGENIPADLVELDLLCDGLREVACRDK